MTEAQLLQIQLIHVHDFMKNAMIRNKPEYTAQYRDQIEVLGGKLKDIVGEEAFNKWNEKREMPDLESHGV